MKLFRKRKKVHNENWRIWDFFNDEDQYGLITYDVTYLENKSSYAPKAELILDISIPDRWLDEGRFPIPEGHHELLILEDELIASLEKHNIDCMQVIRLTHEERRTFVFEVVDLVQFLNTLKSWTETVHSFEMSIDKYEPWTYYKQWEPNEYNWQQINNQQVIEQLMYHGSNSEKPHKLEFSFGGEPAQLEELRTKLINEGGKFLMQEGDLLEIEYEVNLDNHEIDPLTFFLFDTAAEFNCKYEGWRAAIVR